MTWRSIGHQDTAHVHVSDLKICDLCGALNLAANHECFVCGWHGRFEHRPEVVRIAMELAERRSGRLDPDQLTSPCSRGRSAAGGFFAHLVAVLRRLCGSARA